MIARELRGLIVGAIEEARSRGEISTPETPDFVLERPRHKAHGDWATNAALVLAGAEGRRPREVAEVLARLLSERACPPAGAVLRGVEVAGPGFINLALDRDRVLSELARVAGEGEAYGRWDFGAGARMNVEFVSANPVGPLHVGHGRWAALGDALCNLLEAVGFQVDREFYLNDFGTQMEVFAASVEARYLELVGRPCEFPAEGYQGSYVVDIARQIMEEDGGRLADAPPGERREELGERAYGIALQHIRRSMDAFGVHFDIWFSERELQRGGAVREVVAGLLERGLAYERDGAVWMATSRFGDDKDRVLVRSNGAPTYFAADIAYHLNKMERGYDRLINIWGADHHGYVRRMQAAMEASGYPDRLEVILGQLVNLKRGGEPVRMSKRTGEMVTFDELLEEVGRDAARYLFLTRSQDTALDFDIQLAVEQSMENPVYYVQYAHARICSILRYGEGRGVELSGDIPGLEVLRLLDSEEEWDLAMKLFEFEELVRDAALARAPHRLTRYLEELAAAFHVFYNRHRVIGDDADLTSARLFLCRCVLQVLRNGLALLGVSAPERM
ncbi:MAG: arginine--tRNA ligase [Actinobacteria bacterium]|nr:arginine--tRNA ligase [Actinomycetota bacterium]MDI6830737.1 arginine--tRNA ligase [Actinomycetota bacterium]